jgi:putative heme-binding domain-containing protein
MPRLGAALVDPLAVPVISRWIEELGPADTRDAETQELRRTLAEYCDERNDKPPVDAQAIKQQFASSLQTTDQALRMAVAVSDDGVAHGVKVAIAQAARTADPLVRDLFERFLPASERPKRLGSVFDPTEILMSAGDVEQGRELFFRNTALACSQCHRVLGLGEAVGPDLSQIGTKYTREELLAQLIEPSRRIDPPYQTYRAETTDGRTFVGLLQTQSADEVVLRTAQNQDMTVRREQIEALELQSVSLMPDRLLSELTAQEAADLLAFLQSLRSGP